MKDGTQKGKGSRVGRQYIILAIAHSQGGSNSLCGNSIRAHFGIGRNGSPAMFRYVYFPVGY